MSGAWKTHLLLLQSLLDRVYVLLHCHVDELVLGLGLHHAGALLPHPLDGLRDVDVAIQTWSANHNRDRRHQKSCFNIRAPVVMGLEDINEPGESVVNQWDYSLPQRQQY